MRQRFPNFKRQQQQQSSMADDLLSDKTSVTGSAAVPTHEDGFGKERAQAGKAASEFNPKELTNDELDYVIQTGCLPARFRPERQEAPKQDRKRSTSNRSVSSQASRLVQIVD